MSENLLLHLRIYCNPANNLVTTMFTELALEKWVDKTHPCQQERHTARGKRQLNQSYAMQVGDRTREIFILSIYECQSLS